MNGQICEKYDYAVTTGPTTTVWAVSTIAALHSLHSLWSNYEFQRSMFGTIVGSLHEFLFAKYKMKYFYNIFKLVTY